METSRTSPLQDSPYLEHGPGYRQGDSTGKGGISNKLKYFRCINHGRVLEVHFFPRGPPLTYNPYQVVDDVLSILGDESNVKFIKVCRTDQSAPNSPAPPSSEQDLGEDEEDDEDEVGVFDIFKYFSPIPPHFQTLF